MRKMILITASLLLFFSILIAEEAKTEQPASDIKEPQSMEEAFETGKPVVVLFYTTKSCKCTNQRCKEGKELFKSYSGELGEEYTSLTVDVSKFQDITKTYKLFALPVIVVFNVEGTEVTRLNHPKISKDDLTERLAELEQATEEPGADENTQE